MQGFLIIQGFICRLLIIPYYSLLYMQCGSVRRGRGERLPGGLQGSVGRRQEAGPVWRVPGWPGAQKGKYSLAENTALGMVQ